MLSIMETVTKRPKTGGRQKGTLNRITADIRQALRDLAEGNAHRVQESLDRVMETDPAEFVRLWLSLLRFVTPQLQATAIADLTPKSTKQRLAEMTDEQLMREIINSPEAAKLAHEGVKTMDELLLRIVEQPNDELLR